jgi:hypothetical protein
MTKHRENRGGMRCNETRGAPTMSLLRLVALLAEIARNPESENFARDERREERRESAA